MANRIFAFEIELFSQGRRIERANGELTVTDPNRPDDVIARTLFEQVVAQYPQYTPAHLTYAVRLNQIR